MIRLIDANALFGGKLSDAVKYGNKDEEQQHFSYGTLMMYEIADEVDSAPTIAPVRGNTEGDRIRGMSDLELAEYLYWKIRKVIEDAGLSVYEDISNTDTISGILEFLKQPAKMGGAE